MACEDLQAQVASLQQQLLTENQEAAALPKGPDRTQLLADIKEHQADLAAAKQALADCLATAPPPPPPVPVVAAPRDILEIQWTNHQPPDQSRHDWAAQVVGGSATKFFPDIDFEWVNVLDPTQEYDDPPVGATGWVISPDVARVPPRGQRQFAGVRTTRLGGHYSTQASSSEAIEGHGQNALKYGSWPNPASAFKRLPYRMRLRRDAAHPIQCKLSVELIDQSRLSLLCPGYRQKSFEIIAPES
jgi:hypothetical protein